MGDREYWQEYRSKLSSRIELVRASLENRSEGTSITHVSAFDLTHRNIRDVQQMREDEQHLAAVERMLAGNGQLE